MKRRGSFDDPNVGQKRSSSGGISRTHSFEKLSTSGSLFDRSLPALEPVETNEKSDETSVTPKKLKHYAGLANQGATCYMNSLLQTLFMTPEFRRVLYSWRYDATKDDEEAFCIPLQLQLLFGKMQLTDMRSTTTTALTKSFGWTGRESFQQHDVQELARVLFDALEKSLGHTEKAQLTNLLFKGTLRDFVRCKQCNKERSRQDNFLDLSLVIKPFGSTKAVGSVEEALAEFIKAEVLDGSEKVTCDNCNEKTASVKGLDISEPPYLLQLQLKRFVFDYETMDRQKLNDRVTFPLTLDLNPYVRRGGEEAVAGVGSADDVVSSSDEASLIASRGPFVYELYAVLVHSGGARAGHYYAYIKDLDEQTWHCFNDSSVTAVDVKEVLAAAGEQVTTMSGYSYSSSANAYMLMYRRAMGESKSGEDAMEKALGLPLASFRKFPTDKEVPESVLTLIAQEELEAKQAEDVAKLARETIHIQVKFESQQKYLKISRRATIAEATEAAWNLFELGGAAPTSETTVGTGDEIAVMVAPTRNIPLDCIRLRKYAAHTDTAKEPLSYSGKSSSSGELPEDTTSRTLEAAGVDSYTSLIIETRPSADVPWQPYDPDAIVLQCYVFSKSADAFEEPIRLEISKSATLAELGEKIAGATGLARDRLRLMRINTHGLNPDAKEYLTHAALGLQPLSAQEARVAAHNSLPTDDAQRVIGDTMVLGTDLGLRFYDTVKVYVEELEGSRVLPAFDPFNQDAGGASAAADSDPTNNKSSSGGFSHFNRFSTVSIGDRGLRSITAADSVAVRAFERSMNSVEWKLVDLNNETKPVMLDQRMSGRAIYDLVSRVLGVPVGEFILKRETITGRILKLTDEPNCVRESAWMSTPKGGTLHASRGPTPASGEFYGTLLWHIPDADIRLGGAWLPEIEDVSAVSATHQNATTAEETGAGALPLVDAASEEDCRGWLPEIDASQPDVAADSCGVYEGYTDQRYVNLTHVVYTLQTPTPTLIEKAAAAFAKLGRDITGYDIRVRTKAGVRLGVVWPQEGQVADNHRYPYDYLELAVELVRHDLLQRVLPRAAKTIYVCWWDQGRGCLTRRQEVHVNTMHTVQQFCTRLQKVPAVAEWLRKAHAAVLAEKSTADKDEEGQPQSPSDPIDLLYFAKVDAGRQLPESTKLTTLLWAAAATETKSFSSYSLAIEDGTTIILAYNVQSVKPSSSSSNPMTISTEWKPASIMHSGAGGAGTTGTVKYVTPRYTPRESGIKILTKADRDAQKAGVTAPEAVTASTTTTATATAAPASSASTHSSVRDYLPGAATHNNPLYARGGQQGAPTDGDMARKVQEEMQMEYATIPDGPVADTSAAGGMALFDDFM